MQLISKTIIPRALILGMFLITISHIANAQKYKSKSSNVHFFSDAPVEDIEATNLDGQSAFDLYSGEIVFSIPIKSFTFEKSLMQEHFNENYLESDKFPKAIFKGKISDYNLNSAEEQNANAIGKITIHGIEKDLEAQGQIRISEDSLKIQAKFPIKLEDFKIKIPKVVFYNIAEIVDVTISFDYEKID